MLLLIAWFTQSRNQCPHPPGSAGHIEIPSMSHTGITLRGCSSRYRCRSRRPSVEFMEPRLLLTAYVVQSTADNASTGTLRWAVLQANANPGPSTIQFDIPSTGVQRIALSSPLPQIVNPIVIDGTTEPGYAGHPSIEIDGAGAGSNCNGLVITGGQSVIQGLVISGFSGAGIVLEGGSGSLVQANLVGTNAGGTSALANGKGILIVGSSSNTIGGSAASQGNLISGNLGAGIELVRSSQDATNNLITGNLIGTTANGSSALGNQGDGILINGATGNVIGGSSPSTDNVVSANLENGIELASGASATLITGNLVGTTADGLTALGNRDDGILLSSATSNTIGGTSAGDGNVISGNLGNGLETFHPSTNNLLEGNSIGTDRTGMLALGNLGNGICLGSGGNSVGGRDSGAGNTIAYNGTGSVGAGVQLVGLVTQDTILSNSIHDNAGLGINLGDGPTPNHQPGTIGPNSFQNYPILTLAKTDGKITTITGTLLAAANSTFTLQLFWSPRTDPSGYGQGQVLFFTTAISTDQTGNGSITLSLPALPPGVAISATATSGSGNTSEFSPDISLQGIFNLGVSIDASPSPVGVGGTLTYSVTVTNYGMLTASDVAVTDQLPSEFAVTADTVSQGNPPVVAGQTIVAALGTIPAGATAMLTISGTVNSGPSLSDTASVTLAGTDSTPSNLTATVTTPVAPVANLSLTMTPSAGTVRVGDSLTYSLTVVNQGPSPATNIVINLPLGPSVAFQSATTSQGSASFASGLLLASIGSLATGAQATMSVDVQAVGAGTFTTRAAATADQALPTRNNNLATAKVVIDPVVNLVVSLAATPSPVAVGQDLLYTLSVTNQGPDAASAVTLQDVLPAGVTFVSASSNVGGPPSLSGGIVTANLGGLSVGSVGTVQIIVQPTAPAGSILVDTASVSSAEYDASSATASTSITVPVRDVSNLALSISPSGASVPIGQELSYTINVSNPGPADEPDAVVAIPLPSDVNLVSDSSTQSSVPVFSQGTVSVDLGAIPVGGAATVTLTVSPQASALGSLTMSASVQGYNADVEPAQGQASATVSVIAAAGLSIAITPQPAPAHQSQALTYTVTVSNAGPSDDTGVVVTSPLPQGALFVSATSSQAAQPILQSGGISAVIGTLLVGQSATVTIVVQPSQPAPPPTGLVMSAQVSGDDFVVNPGRTTVSTSVPILPSDDLVVSFAPVQGGGEVGKNLTLTAMVSNLGPSPATGVDVQLPLSAAAQVVSVSGVSTSPTFQVQAGVLVAGLGSLAAGASTTLTLILKPMVVGPAIWTASVSGDEYDLTSANNRASVNVAIAESPGVLQFAGPSTIVNDTVGFASIPVVRSLGTLGTVTVHYQTLAGGTATPGVNYQPTSGTLTFAQGQSSGTILVPIIDDYYNNHDIVVPLAITAPTGGAVLGNTTTSILTIHDTDPDFTPPQISGVNWSGTAAAITNIVVSFSEPLAARTATDPASYQLANLGTSGQANPASSLPVAFSNPVYNAATNTVTLIPLRPLAAGQFYRLQVDGTGVAPLLDLAGNALAGAGAGMTGTNYVALIGRGTTLKYYDQPGNLVTLKVTGGGYLDEIRDPSGNGLLLTLENGVPHKTVLSGTVTRTKGKGNGVTTLGAIQGLGKFGAIRVKLTNPPFLVREYPFTMLRGRSVGTRK